MHSSCSCLCAIKSPSAPAQQLSSAEICYICSDSLEGGCDKWTAHLGSAGLTNLTLLGLMNNNYPTVYLKEHDFIMSELPTLSRSMDVNVSNAVCPELQVPEILALYCVYWSQKVVPDWVKVGNQNYAMLSAFISIHIIYRLRCTCWPATVQRHFIKDGALFTYMHITSHYISTVFGYSAKKHLSFSPCFNPRPRAYPQ